MNALVLSILSISVVAAAGEGDPVPTTINCISSNVIPLHVYKTTIVWNINGWSNLLDFSSPEKDKPDFTLPITDPSFPANGSIRIVFGRPRSGFVSYYAKMQTAKHLVYNMKVDTIVGKTIMKQIRPLKSWTFQELEREFYTRLNEPEFSSVYSDPMFRTGNKTERDRLLDAFERRRRIAEANIYLGHIPAFQYEDFQQVIKKQQTGSTTPELTLVVQLSAKEMASSNSTSNCSSIPGYKTFLEDRKETIVESR